MQTHYSKKIWILAILLASFTNSKAQSPMLPGHLYSLTNAYSQKALEISGGGLNAGDKAQQWTRHNWAHQLWLAVADALNPNYVKIVNRNSGKVLEVENAGLNIGDLIQQGDDNGSAAQRWEVLPIPGISDHYPQFVFRNVNSGRVLEIAMAETADGGFARQWELLPRDNTNYFFTRLHQEWILGDRTTEYEPNSYGGVYTLQNVNSGLFLSLGAGLILNSGAPVRQYSTAYGTNGEWQIYKNYSGNYDIVNRASGQELGVAGYSSMPLALVEQRDFYANGPGYQWVITSGSAPGRIRLSPEYDNGLCLEAPNTINGAQAVVNTYSANSTAQEWNIVYVSSHRSSAGNTLTYTMSPNPATDEVVIQSSNAAAEDITWIQVYDNCGKLRLEQAAHKEATIRLKVGNLPMGFYTVHLLRGRGVVNHQRLQIER